MSRHCDICKGTKKRIVPVSSSISPKASFISVLDCSCIYDFIKETTVNLQNALDISACTSVDPNFSWVSTLSQNSIISWDVATTANCAIWDDF